MKKYLVAIAVAGLLSLTGCGGNEEEPEGTMDSVVSVQPEIVPEGPVDIELPVGQYTTLFDGQQTVRYTVDDIKYLMEAPRFPGLGKPHGIQVFIKFTVANFGNTKATIHFGDYFLNTNNERFEASGFIGDGPQPDLADELNVGESATGWNYYNVPGDKGFLVDDSQGQLVKIPLDPPSREGTP